MSEVVCEHQDLTPKQTVDLLDQYIIGQKEAKRAVAIALRNRWRRLNLDDELREEVLPKNILMIGSTGVGKTEISRRLAKLVSAPFVKIEATKFTEVGYVGRDVEQIIRDLLEVSIHMMREKLVRDVQDKAQAQAEERVLDAFVGENASAVTRESFRQKLKDGELDEKHIDIELADNSSPMSSFDVPGMPGASVGMLNLGDMFSKFVGNKRCTKRLLVKDAYEPLVEEESSKLIDQERVVRMAIEAVEQNGIVFLDEIDKVCANHDEARGGRGDVSREGVQRDLLPIIEGTTVSTKHGTVKTDHILFIASGAFHLAKPSDLLPELQGRLPIRVELRPLTSADFRRILTEPKANLIRQYVAMLATEGVELQVTSDAIDEIAQMAADINQSVENIGARRLHTILERILDEVSFEACDLQDQTFVIDAEYVRKNIGDLAKNTDLSRYIL